MNRNWRKHGFVRLLRNWSGLLGLILVIIHFLGLGVIPPAPSWGSMLSESRVLMELAPWLVFMPGIAIMVAILGFNLLGDGLRDVLDPKLA